MLKTIRELMNKGQLAQAGALLWQLQKQNSSVPREWLDLLLNLIAKLDSAGFRPQAHEWLHQAEGLALAMGLHLSKPASLPAHVSLTVVDKVEGRALLRYPAFESSDSYIYVVEISGACNLRCPSCPVGNMSDEPRPKGLMAHHFFEKILEKIAIDRPGVAIVIHLFNWGEPMLNPDLDLFIESIRKRGWKSIVSTTLNVSRGLDRLVKAAPDLLKISLSGWRQEDYMLTHVRGNIERVKDNMKILRKLMDDEFRGDRNTTEMRVVVGYHLYKHNNQGAFQMKKFVHELGFQYMENPAVIQPIERNLDLLSGHADSITSQVADMLLMHPREISRTNRQRRSGNYDCELRFNMTAINVDGSVALCCGTFSKNLQLHDCFLDANVNELELLKYESNFCAECRRCGFDYTVNDVMIE